MVELYSENEEPPVISFWFEACFARPQFKKRTPFEVYKNNWKADKQQHVL